MASGAQRRAHRGIPPRGESSDAGISAKAAATSIWRLRSSIARMTLYSGRRSGTGRVTDSCLLNQTGDPDQNHRADEGDNDGTDQTPTRRNTQQPEQPATQDPSEDP